MIWIVDDDFAYADALKSLLSDEIVGAMIEKYRFGELAIAEARQGKRPLVVILDMTLPISQDDIQGAFPPKSENDEPNGIRMVRQLAELGILPQRIVVITALHRRSVQETLINLGVPADQCLLKPARTDDIVLIVRRVLNREQRR